MDPIDQAVADANRRAAAQQGDALIRGLADQAAARERRRVGQRRAADAAEIAHRLTMTYRETGLPQPHRLGITSVRHNRRFGGVTYEDRSLYGWKLLVLTTESRSWDATHSRYPSSWLALATDGTWWDVPKLTDSGQQPTGMRGQTLRPELLRMDDPDRWRHREDTVAELRRAVGDLVAAAPIKHLSR